MNKKGDQRRMNPQLNKGILEMILLLQLQKSDNYAYILSKKAAESLGVTEGAVYPVLKRLEKKNLVSTYDIPHGKRVRKNYHLLDSGEDYLTALLEQWKKINQAVQNNIKENFNEK